MTWFIASDAPHRWLRTDRRGRIVAAGIAATLDELVEGARRDGTVVAVLPGEQVLTRRIAVPASGRRKARAAIPYALEDTLAEDVGELHFTLLAFAAGDGLVAIAGRRLLLDVVERFHGTGIRLAALVADYQLLPGHRQARIVVADDGGGRVCVRDADGTGAVLDGESLPIWWASADRAAVTVAVNHRDLVPILGGAGATLSEWEIGADFRSWLTEGAVDVQSLNLLGDDLLPAGERRGVRRWALAAALLAVAVIGRLAIDGYDYRQLGQRATDLDGRISRLMSANFPEVTRIVNPRVQLQQRIDALRGAVGANPFPMLLRQVARAVRSAAVEVTELSYRDGTLTVACTTTRFSTLDTLRERLADGGGVDVELVSSGSLDDKVSGRFRIQPAGTEPS